MPNFAANLSMMFQEHAFLDRFEAAARAGFKAVELLFPYQYEPEQLARLLKQHGLTLALFNAPPGDWAAGDRGIAALPGREKEFEASIDQILRYGPALGCGRVHLMAGVLPTGVPRTFAESTFASNLRKAGARLAAQGIAAVIEPINRRDMPGYFLSEVADAVRLIGISGSSNVFLQLDLYHRQIMGGDLAATIREHLPQVRHIQIAGVPERHEPDIGEINYPYLFDLLDGLGYGGWIGCEYRPRAGTVEGLGWARPYGIVPGAQGAAA